jgi:hypothetical protein
MLAAQCEVYFTKCPPNITVFATNDNTGIGVWPVPVAADDCGSNIELYTKWPCGSEFPLGTTDVVYYAVSASGSVAVCKFTVTVIRTFNNNSGLKCPPDVTVNADPTTCHAVGVELGTAVSNDQTPCTNLRNNAPERFFRGMNAVTWTGTDAKGASVNCRQLVMVTPVSDECASRVSEQDKVTEKTARQSRQNGLKDLFKLSPNPFSDHMVLSVNHNQDLDLLIQVFNQQQQLVVEKHWPSGSRVFEMDTANWPAGVYPIKVSTSEGAYLGVLRGVKL